MAMRHILVLAMVVLFAVLYTPAEGKAALGKRRRDGDDKVHSLGRSGEGTKEDTGEESDERMRGETVEDEGDRPGRKGGKGKKGGKKDGKEGKGDKEGREDEEGMGDKESREDKKGGKGGKKGKKGGKDGKQDDVMLALTRLDAKMDNLQAGIDILLGKKPGRGDRTTETPHHDDHTTSRGPPHHDDHSTTRGPPHHDDHTTTRGTPHHDDTTTTRAPPHHEDHKTTTAPLV